MSKLFSPTLVISVGPSAKKALNNLDDMIKNVPSYLKEVIELQDVEEVDSAKDIIQRSIDEKLLLAKNINKLIDMGYKIRTENTANIKINMYIFWDVYGVDFPIIDLVKKIFEINYCVVDKRKHSGLTLIILPILDMEWKYRDSKIIKSKEEISELIKYLGIQDNMININSKVFLMHPVSNDGLRTPKYELEYVCAVLTYLSILPSKNPPLINYSKRLLKHEGDYKVGTIGVSTLTIFKDKIKEQFTAYLINDLIDYSINYESKNELSSYVSNSIIEGNYIVNILSEGVSIGEKDNIKLALDKEFMLNPIDKTLLEIDVEKIAQHIESWEDTVKVKYVQSIEEKISFRLEKLKEEAKEKIKRDLDSVINFTSLREGKRFLKILRDRIDILTVQYSAKEIYKPVIDIGTISKKVEGLPNNIGYWIKILCFMLFYLYGFFEISKRIGYLSNTAKIIICSLSIIAFLGIAYFTLRKKYNSLIKQIKKYEEEVCKREGSIINKYISDNIVKYYDFLIEFIKEEIQEVDEAIDKCRSIKVNIEKFKEIDDTAYGNLVTDLFDYRDRRKFYEYYKEDIPDIYLNLIKEIGGYKKLNDNLLIEKLKNFSDNIAKSYTNIDFYEYVKFKWGNDRAEGIRGWIGNGLIKSKELLQFNQDDNLEQYKIFIGSKEFIDGEKDILINSLSNYDIVTIDGKDIYTNCISIIKVSLGINIDTITPFINITRGGNR